MTSSNPNRPSADFARDVHVTNDRLVVELTDGRVISVPVDWYPRLAHGHPEERAKFELIGKGQGIHWPDLDEDLSVEGILAGMRSGESQSSFDRWLERRAVGKHADPTRG